MESHKLSLRVQLLEQFLRFLTEAETEIRYASPAVAEVIARHKNGLSFLGICEQKMRQGEVFQTAWNTALECGTQENGLHQEDVFLLRDFGQEFGTSDVEGQLAHFRLYKELTHSRLQTAREEKKQKGKLFQMLGIFSGLCAALLLC